MSRTGLILAPLLVLPAILSAAPCATEKNSLGQNLVLLEGGRYIRGSDAREEGIQRDFPLHINGQYLGNAETPAHVTWITKPFWIAATEVTVGQWKAFVAATGYLTTAESSGVGIVGWSPTPEDKPLYESHDFERKPEFTWKNPGFAQSDGHPVVGVSWTDVRAFLDWLGKKENVVYRLPTEAEWEFACRAGTSSWFSFGDEPRGLVHRHANLGNVELEKHRRHSAERQWLLDWEKEPPDGHVFTAPVGSFEANPFGLHDFHGNVWEWCADLWLDTHYQRYASSDRRKPRPFAVDPVNEGEAQTETNHFRTIRGGSWYNGPVVCRSPHRTYWDEPDAAAYLGFRVVREADPEVSTTAREAYEAERSAMETVEQAGGVFGSSNGITLTVRFENDQPDPVAFAALGRITGIEGLAIGAGNRFPLTKAYFEGIASASALKSIEFLGSYSFEPDDLALLASLEALESLSFSRATPVQDAHLAALAEVKTLTSFRAYGTEGGITDEGVRKLAGNRGLRVLELNETEATGAFLSEFAGCPLETFVLTKPYNAEGHFDDSAAARLAGFPGLRVVRLNGQGLIGDPTLSVLGGLGAIEELTLQGCSGFSAEGFVPLGRLVKLRTLDLQGTAAGDAALVALGTIPRLQSLRLGGGTITDEGFSALTELFSIEYLHIESCSASDEGIALLGRINRLKQLDLGAPGIIGSGLAPLARLPFLDDLRLRCPGLTDVAFDHLAKAKSLRKLRLAERGSQPPAALTDAGLLRLAPATGLVELWLPRNDTALTEAGMEALKALLPKTGVIPYTVEWKPKP